MTKLLRSGVVDSFIPLTKSEKVEEARSDSEALSHLLFADAAPAHLRRGAPCERPEVSSIGRGCLCREAARVRNVNGVTFFSCLAPPIPLE